MSNQPVKIGPSTVFLVSGGGRGITARCVIRLAQEYHCKFILLGRSALPEAEPAWASGLTDETLLKKGLIEAIQAQGEKPVPAKVQKALNALLAGREIRQTLQAIAEAGGQAEYLAVDVTSLTELQQALPPVVQRLGPVNGIIHGAGNLADKLIENKTAQDFETVYAAKVQGLENLLTCVPADQLDFLVLFSSVAGFYGNSGQADYALANEILNKTAFLVKQQHPACRVVTLNWGPWEGGMVTPTLKDYFAKRQVELISFKAGTQKLVEVLTGENPEATQLVIGSPLRPLPVPPGPELKTYRLHRKLTLEANPFLLDHVIGGNPVLPAICAINWVANACEQLYPGYTFYSSDSNKVLKGIVFDTTLASEYVLEVKELPRQNEDEISCETIVWSYTGKNRMQFHYSARPTLRRVPLPAPRFEAAVPIQSEGEADGTDYYTNGTLFHGPSFQGVRRLLEISREKVVLECYLPPLSEQRQGQFPVQTFNPFGVDVQLQCLLIWARHYYQAASLPLKIERVEQYRPVPFGSIYYAAMQVQTSSETGLVANVTAYDAQGRIYTIVSGAEVTISKRLNELFVAARPQAVLPV